jgi:type IV pilus assembly protein PilO
MDARVEKILNLPAYQRIIIVVVLMGLIGAAFYFSIYQGQISEYEQLVGRRDSAMTVLKKNERIAAKLDVYKMEYEKLEADLKEALNELPLKKEIPNLLTNIGLLAKEQGLDVLRFKPEQENLKEFYAEVPVSLKLNGTYHQAALFFDAVGKMERLVNIQELKMGQGKEVDGLTKLAIDCRATTFRFVENAEGSSQPGRSK